MLLFTNLFYFLVSDFVLQNDPVIVVNSFLRLKLADIHGELTGGKLSAVTK